MFMNTLSIPLTALFLSLIILFGCKNKEPNQIIENCKTIDIIKYINKDIKLNISDYIDTLYYIKPEDIINAPIGRYNKVIYKNDTIVILDDKLSVFIYNSSGKYINSFNKKGRGPGEYEFISRLDLYHNKIYILDYYNNIMVYNFKGEQLLKVKTPFRPSFIKESYNRIFTYTVPPNLISSDFYRFSVFDPELNKLNVFNRTFYKNMDLDVYTSVYNNLGNTSFYIFKDTLSFCESIRDTIFRVTKDYKIIPKYYLSLGSKALPFNISLTKEGLRSPDEYFQISGVFETEKLIFIKVLLMPERHANYILINKSDYYGGNLVFNYNIIDYGFHNDFDGGYPFWPQYQVDEKTMITWFGARFKTMFSDDYFSQINPKYPKLAEQFSNEIFSKDYPNELIMIVKFK